MNPTSWLNPKKKALKKQYIQAVCCFLKKWESNGIQSASFEDNAIFYGPMVDWLFKNDPI